jgi:D-glycero-alpha-D-manno-heptose-7-phosphate kinase
MIITRTPFRMSFAGGGSDLEVFHSKEAGARVVDGY